MIKSILISKECPSWFKLLGGKKRNPIKINFENSINVLSGPNGSGKSTVLDILHSYLFDKNRTGVQVEITDIESKREKPVFFVSTEDLEPKKNLSEISPFDQDGSKKVAYWMSCNYLSHGQMKLKTIRDIIRSMEGASLVCLDEPEVALDPENLIELREELKVISRSTQVIIVSHHPIFILDENINLINLCPKTNYRKKLNTFLNFA